MWLINSSIGRKLVMAITGAVLVLFVTFHCLMNGVALFWPSAYNLVCEFLGANWYALVGTVVIAALLILHIVIAVMLTLQNRKARGNDRYDVTSKPKQVEWASQNMLVLGIVILAFMVVHLIQFWYKMQFSEVLGIPQYDPEVEGVAVPYAAGTWFIQMAFSAWYTLPIYLIGFIALWFHLTHGMWSMFQSIGWDGAIWFERLKKIANWWTSIVVLLFIAEGIVFTINAKSANYTSCPALQEQYIEMMAEHNNGAAVADCCAEEVKTDCCADKAECTKEGKCEGKHECDGKHECNGKHECDGKHECNGNCPSETVTAEVQEVIETVNQ